MTKHVGRNDACPCGSGKKFKRCCEIKEQKRSSRLLAIVVGGAVLAALLIGITQFAKDPVATGSRRVWSAEHGHYHDLR